MEFSETGSPNSLSKYSFTATAIQPSWSNKLPNLMFNTVFVFFSPILISFLGKTIIRTRIILGTIKNSENKYLLGLGKYIEIIGSKIAQILVKAKKTDIKKDLGFLLIASQIF